MQWKICNCGWSPGTIMCVARNCALIFLTPMSFHLCVKFLEVIQLWSFKFFCKKAWSTFFAKSLRVSQVCRWCNLLSSSFFCCGVKNVNNVEKMDFFEKSSFYEQLQLSQKTTRFISLTTSCLSLTVLMERIFAPVNTQCCSWPFPKFSAAQIFFAKKQAKTIREGCFFRR